MIEVLSIPPLATVQDLGRHGHWFQGLGQAGVMDDLSHKVANLLLGNAENAATLEIPLTPVRLRFHTELAISVVGAVNGARLDNRALPRAWAGVVNAGQVLELGKMSEGARIYLALPGGIDVPMVLGSRSTQLRETFGGLDGRMLAAGDFFESVESCWDILPQAGISVALPPLKAKDKVDIELRTLASADHDQFEQSAQQAFWSTPYRVSSMSNRQGYRLEGEKLVCETKEEMRSHGIVPGIVQVPGNGQPIIQLADTATMGGYRSIGAVIEPDLWRLGQARAGEMLSFVQVSIEEAEIAARELQSVIASLRAYIEETRELLGNWV